jgi:DNA-binding transcriptional LysR family regulator
MDWNDLRYFLAIARSGSLARAAHELSVEHTTVSRRLSALEADLGTRNSIAAVARAAVEGIGIAPLPCFAAAQEPGLVRITPRLIRERDIQVVVHPDLVGVARVRTTMDFLIELFHRDAPLWSGIDPIAAG